MADKKLPEKTSKGVSDPIPAGQGRARPTTRRAAAISPEDRADRTKTKPEDAYTDIVADGPGLPGVGPIGRHFVSARPGAPPHDLSDVKFKSRAATAQLVERTRKAVTKAQRLIGATEQGFTIGSEALDRVLASDESINSAKLHAYARQTLRRSLEQMDDAERKQTIAALMAYIGQLQTSGALESVPSGRLARVAKLIGEAAEIVDGAPRYIPQFAEREPDPKTGKLPTTIEWFERKWKPLVLAGEATGDEIRRVDAAFYNNFAAALSKRGEKIKDYLPPSPTRGKKDETPEERAERIRRHSRESKRRARGRPSEPT